jgi:hypothetical protein
METNHTNMRAGRDDASRRRPGLTLLTTLFTLFALASPMSASAAAWGSRLLG